MVMARQKTGLGPGLRLGPNLKRMAMARLRGGAAEMELKLGYGEEAWFCESEIYV